MLAYARVAGKKFGKCVEWGVPAVSLQWLQDCIIHAKVRTENRLFLFECVCCVRWVVAGVLICCAVLCCMLQVLPVADYLITRDGRLLCVARWCVIVGVVVFVLEKIVFGFSLLSVFSSPSALRDCSFVCDRWCCVFRS